MAAPIILLTYRSCAFLVIRKFIGMEKTPIKNKLRRCWHCGYEGPAMWFGLSVYHPPPRDCLDKALPVEIIHCKRCGFDTRRVMIETPQRVLYNPQEHCVGVEKCPFGRCVLDDDFF